MTENPYDEKMRELIAEEKELFEDRDLLEMVYTTKLAQNARHFGVRFAKKLKHPLTIHIRIPDYMNDIEWMNFLTTDKKQIKENLIGIIERLNEISDKLQKMADERERLSELRKQFDYFSNFPVNDVNAIMETVEKIVDGKSKVD